MSFADVERAVLAAAREKLENRKLRLKDMMEFKSGALDPSEGEIVIEVDALNMHWWVAVLKTCDKRKPA